MWSCFTPSWLVAARCFQKLDNSGGANRAEALVFHWGVACLRRGGAQALAFAGWSCTIIQLWAHWESGVVSVYLAAVPCRLPLHWFRWGGGASLGFALSRQEGPAEVDVPDPRSLSLLFCLWARSHLRETCDQVGLLCCAITITGTKDVLLGHSW